ncbi:GNAT family N-acetyltransferase [Litorimonas sp. WD9-15]|uniref:GNAT family N-acetyltransferase n=1 Tax=Litorimonas sp. WD9-15 TaxID=3418716 RepID=UPI003D051640
MKAQSAGGAIELRHPRWADFEDWAALRRESTDYLRPWEPDVSTAGLHRPAYRARLSRLKKLVQQDRAYPFNIFREGTLVGACNITHIDRGTAQSAKLGYWIGERFTGRGFARAAVTASTTFCFEGLGLHRVEAAVQTDNAASIKVLQAAGFTFEGVARGMLKIDGAWRDHDIYARLSGD